MSADQYWYQVSPDAKLFWDAYPFKGYSELFPTQPSVTGTFSTNPIILHQLAHPPPRPVCVPDETEVSILGRHYPNSDPSDPPWGDIQADLLAVGVAPGTLKELDSRQIVRLLDRMVQRNPSGPKVNSMDEIPATHRDGAHPKGDPLTTECVERTYQISPSTLTRRHKEGHLQGRIKVGKAYVYPHADIAAIASQEAFKEDLARRAPDPESRRSDP